MNILINNNFNSKHISLAAPRNTTTNHSPPPLHDMQRSTKKKSSSKISELITKAISTECISRHVNRKMSHNAYSNTISLINNVSLYMYTDNDDALFTFDEDASTIHSLGSVATYTQVEVMYSVNKWKDVRNVFVNINEVYTISSLISMTVDHINECLMENDKENCVINWNSAMYAVVMAKKNGLPNYDYPEYDKEMKIKDCLKKKYCLLFKGNDCEYLVDKRKLRAGRGWEGKYYKHSDNSNSESNFSKFRSKSSELINASFVQDNMEYNSNNDCQNKCVLC